MDWKAGVRGWRLENVRPSLFGELLSTHAVPQSGEFVDQWITEVDITHTSKSTNGRGDVTVAKSLQTMLTADCWLGICWCSLWAKRKGHLWSFKLMTSSHLFHSIICISPRYIGCWIQNQCIQRSWKVVKGRSSGVIIGQCHWFTTENMSWNQLEAWMPFVNTFSFACDPLVQTA